MKLKWEESKKEFIEKFHIDVLDKDEPEFREITNKLYQEIRSKKIIFIIILTVSIIIFVTDYGRFNIDLNSSILDLFFLLSMWILTYIIARKVAKALASKVAKAQANFVTYVQQQRTLEKFQKESESILHILPP